jgi:hypothetical protein
MQRRAMSSKKPKPMGLAAQIKDAKLSVARSALANPGVFLEYGRYRAAKAAVTAAERELRAAETAWLDLIRPAVDEQRRLSGRCQAARDGDCFFSGCPQLRDDEPNKSGRHCPLDKADQP